MSDIELGLIGRGTRSQVTLTARDVSDALRLINLLVSGQRRGMVAAKQENGSEEGLIFGDGVSLKAKARAALLQRQRRTRFFASSIFSEHAWDMLLALFASEDGEGRLTVSALAGFCGAPLTTALRWLDFLEQRCLVIRQPSPTDRRVMFVAITPLGAMQMKAYFEDVSTFDWPSI